MSRSFFSIFLFVALLLPLLASCFSHDELDFNVTGVVPAEGSFRMSQNNAVRAERYVKLARNHIAQIITMDKANRQMRSSGRDDQPEGDTFIHQWLASQQLYAAVELGAHVPKVMLGIAMATVHLNKVSDQPIIDTHQTLLWVQAAAALNPTKTSALAAQMKGWRGMEREDYNMIKRVRKAISKGKEAALPGQKFQHPVQVASTVSNPADQCNDDGKCVVFAQDNFKEIMKNVVSSMHQHQLWPSRIATVHINLPMAFHDKLAELAIARFKKYKRYWIQRNGEPNGPEDVNNAFFSRQPKSDEEVRSPRGKKWWPELYNSDEYKMLRKIAKASCVEHAMRNGRPQLASDLKKMNLVLWAAIYYKGVKHGTHVHEQSACSGAYYPRSPRDKKTPFIMSDPRGIFPNHIDADSKDTMEPEAPFHHQYAFYPNSGDMVLFPSYVPHRVPPHDFDDARVTFAFNLEGGVDTWARLNV